MLRINTPTAVPDKNGAGKPGFQDGNLATGQIPTSLNALFFNNLQEEMATTVEAAGIALDGEDFGQLLRAIGILFGARSGSSSLPDLGSMVGGEVRDNVMTFTAPSKGHVMVMGTLNLASIATNNFRHELSITTDGGLSISAADSTLLSQSHVRTLFVPAGAVVTLRQRVSATSGAPGTNAVGWLSYHFSGSNI